MKMPSRMSTALLSEDVSTGLVGFPSLRQCPSIVRGFLKASREQRSSAPLFCWCRCGLPQTWLMDFRARSRNGSKAVEFGQAGTSRIIAA